MEEDGGGGDVWRRYEAVQLGPRFAHVAGRRPAEPGARLGADAAALRRRLRRHRRAGAVSGFRGVPPPLSPHYHHQSIPLAECLLAAINSDPQCGVVPGVARDRVSRFQGSLGRR